MPRSGERRGGRILTHQRDTHDCDLLGDDFSVDEMHEELVRTTEKEKNQRQDTKGIQKPNQAHLHFFKGRLSGLLCDWSKKGKG